MIDGTLGSLTRYSSSGAKEAVRTGMRKTRYDFEDFVYSFATVGTLLEIAAEQASGARGKIEDDIDSLLSKQDLPERWNEESIAERLNINLDQPDASANHQQKALEIDAHESHSR